MAVGSLAMRGKVGGGVAGESPAVAGGSATSPVGLDRSAVTLMFGPKWLVISVRSFFRAHILWEAPGDVN